MGQTISVVSGKGGTGKTSFTANVGMALAQMGHPTLCLDCDVGLRNLDIALGMSDCGSTDFTDVMLMDGRLPFPKSVYSTINAEVLQEGDGESFRRIGWDKRRRSAVLGGILCKQQEH